MYYSTIFILPAGVSVKELLLVLNLLSAVFPLRLFSILMTSTLLRVNAVLRML